MTKHSVVESLTADLDLSLSEAQALSVAGRKLTAAVEDVAEAEGLGFDDEPTLVRCSMTPGGVWRVTVNDAIGIVAAGDVRLVVNPKIPPSHLLYLFGRSELFPRIAPSPVAAASGTDFWESSAGGSWRLLNGYSDETLSAITSLTAMNSTPVGVTSMPSQRGTRTTAADFGSFATTRSSARTRR